MTTITLQQDIKTKKKLKDISESSWDKIILDCGNPKKEFLNLQDRTHLYYSRFAEVFLNSNNKKLVTTKGNWWTISNTEAFNDIMKVFPETRKHLQSLDTMIYYATDGSSGTRPLVLNQAFGSLLSNGGGRSNALFNHVLRDGKNCCKIKSLEVFQFLQKYADDTEINIIYPAGETFEENEVQIPGNPPTNNNKLIELTIKKITKDQDGNYQVEVKEKNISGSKTLTFCKSVYKPIPDKDEGFVAHPNTDSFYFFAHNLGKETSVPTSQGSKCIFLIDGSSREGEPTPVLDIINEEKAKWDSLGYTSPEDLRQENKYLVDLDFKKGGESYQLYWYLKKITEDFSKDRLEGMPIDLYPGKSGMGKFAIPLEKAHAFAGWNDENDPLEGFRMNVRIDENFADKSKFLFVLAHEMSHLFVYLKEEECKNKEANYPSTELKKGILDGTFLYKDQGHSRVYWEMFFDGKDWEDGKGKVSSTLEYLKSKLNDQDERDKLDQYVKVSNEKIDNEVVKRVYFPYTSLGENLVGKIRRKKTFDKEWLNIRRQVLRFAHSSINYPLEQAKFRWGDWLKKMEKVNWQKLTETDEASKRWVQIEVKQDENNAKYKIYIYHNNINGIFEWIDKNGEKKEIPAETMNPIADDLFQNLESSCTTDEGWEIEGIISSPRTRNLDESFSEVCGYQTQEQQAQIQIPPK